MIPSISTKRQLYASRRAQMRELITLQQIPVAKDAIGTEVDQAPVKIAEVLASVRPQGQVETTAFGKEAKLQNYFITIDWRSDVDLATRIVLEGGEELDIRQLSDPFRDNELLEIVATRRTP